jgi:hypothetical protein
LGSISGICVIQAFEGLFAEARKVPDSHR